MEWGERMRREDGEAIGVGEESRGQGGKAARWGDDDMKIKSPKRNKRVLSLLKTSLYLFLFS